MRTETQLLLMIVIVAVVPVSVLAMSGGDYQLLGGFWPAGPQALLLCIVNFEHFVELWLHWLDSPCNAPNNWCEGADLDFLGDVGLGDVCELAYWWLAECPPDWPWQ